MHILPFFCRLDIVFCWVYCNADMNESQQSGAGKLIRRATRRQRVAAGSVFLAVAGVFGLMWAVGEYGIRIGPVVCGFKQRYNLPCPTCGMTTAGAAFVHGRVFEAFYIQPAAGLFFSVLAVTGFFALLTAVFGVYFGVFGKVPGRIKARYWVLVVLVVIFLGWAVTLARAIAANAAG